MKCRFGVVKINFPYATGVVCGLKAVRIYVGVAEHVAVFINTEFSTAFIPMAPCVYGAVGLDFGVNEKVLNPLVGGA